MCLGRVVNAKPFYLSKTFWVNVAALLSMAVPQVNQFLKSNPETVVGVLVALNVILRFVTKGAVSLSDSAGGDTGGLHGWLAAAALLGAGLLPSCASIGSALTGAPIPTVEVARSGAKDATVVRVATIDWLQAEQEARAVEAAGPMANGTVWGLYDAGRAADAVRGVFSEPSK